jgi:hypothetical protein
MNIAIDYDGTWDRDPNMWQDFASRARRSSHKVYVVTLRNSQQSVGKAAAFVDGVVYCALKPKRETCRANGIKIDIWIDDMPETIGMGDAGVIIP